MAITLGSNIASLRGQRLLAKTSEELGTVFQRLSSGQRINRASDDSAALAISEHLISKSRLYQTALRNIGDGNSALEIMNGALDNQANIVTRFTELAEQAANGTLSVVQRQALNKEYQALALEYGRIAESTEFNGVKLLLGGHKTNASTINIQAGITSEASSQIGLSLSDTGTISGTINLDYLIASDTVGGISDLLFGDPDYSFTDIADAFGQAVLTGAFIDSNGNSRTLALAFAYDGSAPGNVIVSFYYHNSPAEEISDPTAGVWNSDFIWGASHSLTYDVNSGRVLTTSFESFPDFLPDSAVVTAAFDLYGLRFVTGDSSGPGTSIAFSGVETADRAQSALSTTSALLTQLNQARGSVGALQSRLGFASQVTRAAQLDFAAAASRIRDADIADESSRMVRLNILQQASASVLAQANQQPSLALQLLSG